MREARIVFRDVTVQPVLQVTGRRRVGVLLNREARGRVLDHHGAESLHQAVLSDHALHLLRDLVQSLPACPDLDPTNHEGTMGGRPTRLRRVPNDRSAATAMARSLSSAPEDAVPGHSPGIALAQPWARMPQRR
jgi:hypothetical protein